MSLAYKLWRIGNVLTQDDIKGVIRSNPDTILKPGDEPEYFNLNFTISTDNNISLDLRRSSVSKESMFFTKKLGGAGGGIYYLYPNLVLKLTDKQTLASKLSLLTNTLKSSILKFSREENQSLALIIVEFFEMNKEHPVLEMLNEIKGGIFWFWISINGKTLPDLMPEVWNNWFELPVTQLKEAAPGYDSFSGKETIVGFRPEFKIFSYDQYHGSLNHRVRDNFPLSFESAGKIKLAWIYILEKLVFYYKGLEYILLPNLIMDDDESLRQIISRLVKANAMTKGKPKKLQALRTEEKNLLKNLEQLRRPPKGKKKPVAGLNEQIQELEKNCEEMAQTIEKMDTGYITEFKIQADYLAELKNAVTLDFIFTVINRTNLSFEVKGSIEDVMPSRLSLVVNAMREQKINENIELKAKIKNKTYLQDYFNRDELYFVLSKTQKHNGNRILQERLHLARLLLTDAEISMENLMKRFEFNREYDYAHKKRINNGVRDWINYSSTYTQQEQSILSFFQQLNKIKE
ncbi:CRISPR-associated protein Csh1 [Desulfocicer vacuolatum DSM 3385]|uniref:CRISPR-associated protein Csh1 n=1 Tax=Desulfocicer vacuolatum DSM 3385 TaxID=1121400 RepID=A0A1W2BZW8_9BACT|nr:TM1802 family CRISPR-associated protein [Desulfocicer vacuolatum]SMC78547.1 CRISPR-associated protein Csh1 [Desulfocicer vacuolatum DSM 3385]